MSQITEQIHDSEIGDILENSLEAKIIMQVHDELVLEVSIDRVPEISKLTETVMSNIAALEVNLKVDIGVGNNWDQAH